MAESLIEDVGRRTVRLDPHDMDTIGATPGDIVALIGKNRTVARAMPTLPEFYGCGLAQIDGRTRANAGVGLGEGILVERTQAQPARSLVLTYTDTGQGTTPLSTLDVQAIGELLHELPLIAGDQVDLGVSAAHAGPLSVLGSAPQGPVLVTPQTQITLLPPDETAPRRFHSAYEDIGGLDEEIRHIREMVELPIKYPELFARVGIQPPKGLLLYGPPGTGKTLIARVLASEVRAHFIHVNGPEIMHKYYGESEARLREVFEEASQNAPSIIFLDEIDAIAPRRATVAGEVEKRVVAQLLALMDGLVGRREVVVIGATNMPELLDPALRRPGRFDREVHITIPDEKGRWGILRIHTQPMPLHPSVDLACLAKMTSGYVGADLEMLCKEAGMSALRRMLPSPDMTAESAASLNDLKVWVTMDDFYQAMQEVEPAGTREILIEKPSLTFSDVGGLEELKEELLTVIALPLRHAELIEQGQLTPPRSVFLHGPPGSGKTLLAKALAGELKLSFVEVNPSAISSKWMGEAEKSLGDVFRAVRHAGPCVLFLDHIDILAPRRGALTESYISARVMARLMREMSTITNVKGLIVVAATDRIDLVDPAVLAKFDLQLPVPLPDQHTREKIFTILTRDRSLANDVDITALAAATAGMTGSDIASICKKATVYALKEHLATGGQVETSPSLAARHFAAALAIVNRPTPE
ncbi:MAG: AAA family ATPase [Chloroflexi bacterium]|nr:AAA family ATPase [Chloroflexota bacterium]MCL5074078.1 AAA family ATPase [Chloroflexota bacterium]